MLTKKEILQQLFEHEMKVLEEGKTLTNHSYQNKPELMEQYKKLLSEYKNLLNLTMKFTAISDNQITRLLNHKQPNPHLEFLSYRDSLTELYNRSYVNEIQSTLIVSNEEPLSCLYIDMNGLKLTNDIFGHQVGDEMICSSAYIFNKCCRAEDIIVRWGGDEFLILMPNANSHESEQLKNKIKTQFKKQQKNLPIQLSAAIGVATTTHMNGDLNHLLQQAEQQMYKEKFIESSLVRHNIINELKKTLKNKCLLMHNHIKRVEKMAIAFALELNMKPKSLEMEKLKLVASLHDIGTVVSYQGENSPELEPSNFLETIRGYGEYGYRMAQALGETTVAYGIIGLHENWDGSGFPYGLKKEEIPYLSRIISIIDTYDILIHGLATPKQLSKDEAILEMIQNSGRKFDPYLLDKFVHHFNKKHS